MTEQNTPKKLPRQVEADKRSARWKRILDKATARKAKGTLKEFSELRAEVLGEHTGTSQTSMPPNILILRRKTVRQFPGGLMVALYYSDKLGQYFSIPYGSPQDDMENVITPTALTKEELEQLDESTAEHETLAAHEYHPTYNVKGATKYQHANGLHSVLLFPNGEWQHYHTHAQAGHVDIGRGIGSDTLKHQLSKTHSNSVNLRSDLYENAISHLRKVKAFETNTSLRHKDGTQTRVDPTTANALLTVHDALHPDNQKKMADALEHSKAKFHRMVDFAWKSVK